MFNRKKKAPGTSKPNRFYHILLNYIVRLQHKWSIWMQTKTKHWKSTHQKRFLFFLCLVLGGGSTHSLLQLFKKDPISTFNSAPPTPKPLPQLIHPLPQTFPVSKSDTQVFKRFHRYLDTLNQTPEGKHLYQQFLIARPGFMDSLAFAEKLFNQTFPHY